MNADLKVHTFTFIWIQAIYIYFSLIFHRTVPCFKWITKINMQNADVLVSIVTFMFCLLFLLMVNQLQRQQECSFSYLNLADERQWQEYITWKSSKVWKKKKERKKKEQVKWERERDRTNKTKTPFRHFSKAQEVQGGVLLAVIFIWNHRRTVHLRAHTSNIAEKWMSLGAALTSAGGICTC